jgi:methionyl-tRNA formyltransferase
MSGVNSLKLDILCTDPAHPVNTWLHQWQDSLAGMHEVSILRRATDLAGGDMLFLISCHEIIGKSQRDLYRHTLVIHASDLPQGRGMSPHVWQILEGRNHIAVTLLNAEDALDSGDIWHQIPLVFEGHELVHEINAALFNAELELMTWAVENCWHATPRKQTGTPSFYPRRKPIDSRLDPSKPLAEQFDLLRVSDPQRYPAFFEIRGKRYKIQISRMDD